MAIFTAFSVHSQTLMGRAGQQSEAVLYDVAALNSVPSRSGLSCVVKPLNAQLGFDLEFHSGYTLTIPFDRLAGSENMLTVVFRVTPQDTQGQAAYFEQKYRIPAFVATTKQKAEFHGYFATGEGKFQVEFLARDEADRSCASHWDIVADSHIKGWDGITPLPRGSVAPQATEVFARTAPIKPNQSQTLNVLILLNLSPELPTMSLLPQAEIEALTSILDRIATEPRIGRYSIRAINLTQGELLYGHDNLPAIDFEAIAKSMNRLRVGTIDIKHLNEMDDGAGFLADTLDRGIGTDSPDAIIFVGAHSMLDRVKIGDSLRSLEQPHGSVFYLSYDPDWRLYPGLDLISRLVKSWKGVEYRIRKPEDVLESWSDLMARIPDKDRTVAISGNATQPEASPLLQ